jgi:hypothetical protein
MHYAIKFQPTRPAGNFRDTVRLTRQWALVRLAGIGHAVISRYASKAAAEQALAKVTGA